MDQGSKSPVFIASPFHTKLDDIAEKTYYFAPQDIARLGLQLPQPSDPKLRSVHYHDETPETNCPAYSQYVICCSESADSNRYK